MTTMTVERFPLVAALAIATAAHADPVHFQTNDPDGAMAMATDAASTSGSATEAADDFVLAQSSRITHASFTGIVDGTSAPSDITDVAVEIHRVFPLDSVDPPLGQVPTRANSPSDYAFASRDSTSSGLAYTVSVINPGFNAANSVRNGIHPLPNQTTGGEGAVSGQEIVCEVTFDPPFELPAGHYFFVPRVSIAGADFYWLSAPRPIVAPGTPFDGDLQAWIRNDNLSPDWLRVGGDIVGGGHAFNATFSLDGDTDVVFRDGFDPIAD
jgi:hypothetical protein